MYIFAENDDPEAHPEKSSEVAPFLIVQESPIQPSQIFLAAEQRISFEVTCSMYCPGVLLAAFYTLNTISAGGNNYLLLFGGYLVVQNIRENNPSKFRIDHWTAVLGT